VRDELAPWLKGNVWPAVRISHHLSSGVKPTELIDDLKKIVVDYGLGNEPIAIDMPAVTINFADLFRDAGLNVIDGGPSLFRARMIKTQDEVQCLRITCGITEEIFDAIREAIRPGVRESDLCALINDIAIRRGSDGPDEPVVCSGENTYPNMLIYGMRPIRPGDMIFVDLHVRWRGYHSCVYRVFTCGRATQRQKELYEETRSLTYKAIKEVKAGKTTADIAKVWPSPEHWGFKKWRECAENALGHGIGLDLHEPPYVSPLFSLEHPMKLEENMSLALETYYGALIPDGRGYGEGARTEEDLIVTKEGCEILTKWPIDGITEAWI
jgi:Xaa-Pro dipeptidase